MTNCPFPDSIETVVVASDTIAELHHRKVYTRDLNGRVHHEPRVSALIRDAGREACRLELPDGVVTVGAYDAAVFTQATRLPLPYAPWTPHPPIIIIAAMTPRRCAKRKASPRPCN